MSERDEVASLMRWLQPRGQMDGAMARHPYFADAARGIATNMLAASAHDKALDGLFKDAGRYVAALWATYLHLSGGLTLPRLKDASATSGLLSRGRARAMLIYLRYLGYFEPLPSIGNETTHYGPTARFQAAWRGHLEAALRAAASIEPAALRVIDHFDEPNVFDTFDKAHCEELFASAQATQPGDPYLRIFLHRNAGTQLVWLMMQESQGGQFPPQHVGPLSMTVLARRFSVSRIHLRRLFSEAEREDLLSFEADGSLVLHEPMRTTLEFLYARQLTHLLTAAARTIETHPEIVGSAIDISGRPETPRPIQH